MPRCDRCRAEYSSGSTIGSHDYCMSCYVLMKQEEEKKRFREEQKRQQKAAEEKRLAERKRYEDKLKVEAMKRIDERGSGRAGGQGARAKESDREKKEREMREVKRRELLNQIGRREIDRRSESAAFMDPGSIRMKLEKEKLAEKEARMRKARRGGSEAESPGLATVGRVKRMGEGSAEAEQEMHHMGVSVGHGMGDSAEDKDALLLKVDEDLPEFVAAGEENVKVMFEGRNESEEKITAKLVVSVMDAISNKITCSVMPRARAFEGNGIVKFSVIFNVPKIAAEGPLTLFAQLEENATYVDRDARRSKKVVLRSKVVPEEMPKEKRKNG